jgi:hypothetical protein
MSAFYHHLTGEETKPQWRLSWVFKITLLVTGNQGYNSHFSYLITFYDPIRYNQYLIKGILEQKY